MKALVVGGAGFIGSHLCDRLLKLGYEVICVDNFSLGTRKNILHLQNKSEFKFYELDVSASNALGVIFENEKVEAVFHLAANSDIRASAMNPEIEYRNTYTTTFQILCTMKKYEVKNLFFASTSAIYGDKRDEKLVENMAGLSPVSYYGAAKLGSEALISAFSYMNDMNSLIFRFPNVIGPRLTHGVIFDFAKKLNRNPYNLEILGDGKQTKPYIYVEDLIDAITGFMNLKRSGTEIYNLGVEGSTSVTDIARIFCKEMGLDDVTFHYTGGEGGWKGDVPRFIYCLDKIHAAGWKAKYTSDEAVKKTIKEMLGREVG